VRSETSSSKPCWKRRSAARFSCGIAADREAGTADRTELNSLRPLF
jgi:hypothetical protein